MERNKELKEIAEKLREIFKKVGEDLKSRKLTDRTLDAEVLSLLKNYEFAQENMEIKFSEPQDEVYRAESGRTPYDLLCYGKVNGKNFFIFINNKFGDLRSSARNDVTTYNNLLRLYLHIKEQRLSSEITINKDIIYNRIAGNEFVAYGIFVIDKEQNEHNFFLLEEIRDPFYVNPRNTMFQVRYSPSLGEPLEFYTFIMNLINATLDALQKSINYTKTEIVALNHIKTELMKIKGTLRND
jgi:hypothetical protein